jgi:hypothetical protein
MKERARNRDRERDQCNRAKTEERMSNLEPVIATASCLALMGATL